ncbi:MAG TPA: type II CAAX endopeptidase family protein [Propionibacteriaceae bacterium]|nr:type II CAAX endopeptidase family protein [Propionibacteriaceae bacterium]
MSTEHRTTSPPAPARQTPDRPQQRPALQEAGPVTRFIRRRPLLTFFLWLFTVGQALAFVPLFVSEADTGLHRQTFVVASTLFGLLLPAVVITYVVDGRQGVVSLWRQVAAVRLALGWYALAFLGVPLLAMAITVAFVGWPATTSWSTLAWFLLPHFVLPLIFTFLPNNLWEELAWTGFVQSRLQVRHGAVLAALITGPLFALQHISLAVVSSGGSFVGTVILILVLAAMTTPFRFLTGWLYNRTASVFLVGLVHATGNAVAGGSGYQSGYLAAVYPDNAMAVMSHLLASALLGLVVLVATRGRLADPARTSAVTQQEGTVR